MKHKRSRHKQSRHTKMADPDPEEFLNDRGSESYRGRLMSDERLMTAVQENQ